jgi:hypothetical protein
MTMARAFMTIGSIRNGAVTVRARGYVGPRENARSSSRTQTCTPDDPATGRLASPPRRTSAPSTDLGASEE